MRDVQREPDPRNVALDEVGVLGVLCPVNVMDRQNGLQSTVATVKMSVDLPHRYRGTHLSRFMEILTRFREDIRLESLESMLREMKSRFQAEQARIEFEFPYFIRKTAPVSNASALTDHLCRFKARMGEDFDFVLQVEVPVHTLCPCSREISEKGAHNQRARVAISVRMEGLVWIEDLVEIAEESSSSALYPILKRRDEKYVTESAYRHPRFVEDVAREAAIRLDRDEKVTWYKIEVSSHESIHNYDAYASLERGGESRRPLS
jgi:GTP cyclohydrolase I